MWSLVVRFCSPSPSMEKAERGGCTGLAGPPAYLEQLAPGSLKDPFAKRKKKKRGDLIREAVRMDTNL